MKKLGMGLLAPLALALAACHGSAVRKPGHAAEAARAPASDSGESLAADTEQLTIGGNAFIAPQDWRVHRAAPVVMLTAPEGDSRLALVDVAGADADAAVAAAWAAYPGGARWPLKSASDVPARDGWRQMRLYSYETSANEQRVVLAMALRADAAWTVVIYDMSAATGEKRSAQVKLVLDRLLPKGHSRESFAGRTPHALDAARVDELKRFVEDARRELEVPGVAIGIVQDGQLVFAGGFGVRALGQAAPVDADTLFMIASNTKALTTLMLAKLVAQGRLDWDTPVTRILPQFRLGDADTTRRVLVRHLICACTGLPRQDLEWLFDSDGASPDSVLRTLATMQPTSAFGALFQYSNPMAAAAGYAGGHVEFPGLELGAAYDAAMQSLVFDPLSMHSTTFDYARALRGNHALPHGLDVDGHTVAASMDLNYTVIPARPAGAAWSSVNDMLRYVQMELAQGRLPDGTRYIDAAPLLERRKAQVALGKDAVYGMGLMVDHTWGVPVVHHGGDLLGFHSDMLWLPDANVGAVILTNSDPGVYLRGPFQRRLLEVLFDGEPQAAANVAAAAARQRSELQAERKRLQVPADPTAVAALAGRYHSAALGDLVVRQVDAATWFDFGAWRSEVASRRNDDGSVSFSTISPGNHDFEFIVTTEGGRRGLVLRDAQHEYVFVAQ